MQTGSRAPHDSETCRRIIDAASEEFARHGFSGARVRNIVDAAGVNLASINYHFGGKEGLYHATLGYLAGQARLGPRRKPAERRGQSAERRLHRLVFELLEGLHEAASASPLSRILAYEAIQPSLHMERVLEDLARPQLDRLRRVVREVAGPGLQESAVTLATLSIAGQCLLYLFALPAIDRLYPGVAAGHDARRKLARQVTDFSLAGIVALSAPRASKNTRWRPIGGRKP